MCKNKNLIATSISLQHFPRLYSIAWYNVIHINKEAVSTSYELDLLQKMNVIFFVVMKTNIVNFTGSKSASLITDSSPNYELRKILPK